MSSRDVYEWKTLPEVLNDLRKLEDVILRISDELNTPKTSLTVRRHQRLVFVTKTLDNIKKIIQDSGIKHHT